MSRIILVLGCAAVAACGATTASTDQQPGPAGVEPSPGPGAVQPAPPEANPLDAFAGRYAVDGEIESDECSGSISFVTETMVIDAGARTLYADVIERTFQVSVVDGVLVGEDRFPAEGACPDSTTYIRGRLERAEGGGLVGYVESQWLLPPSCLAPCLVRFRVRATPIQ